MLTRRDTGPLFGRALGLPWPWFWFPLLCLMLVCAGPAWGQKVQLPPEVKGEPGGLVIVAAETDCAALQWLVLDPGLNLIPGDLLKSTRTAVGVAPRAGVYRLLAYGAKGDQASPPAVCRVVVGTPAPEPAPPPKPGPGPTPPPTPAPGGDVRVLILYERQSPLTAAQQATAYAPDLAAYLDRVCVRDGAQPSWRRWDPDQQFAASEPRALVELHKAVLAARPALPAVAVAVGDRVTTFPLPSSAADALAQIQKLTGRAP